MRLVMKGGPVAAMGRTPSAAPQHADLADTCALAERRGCPPHPCPSVALISLPSSRQSQSASGGLERRTQVRHRLSLAAGLAGLDLRSVGAQAASTAAGGGLGALEQPPDAQHGDRTRRLARGARGGAPIEFSHQRRALASMAGPGGSAASAPLCPTAPYISPSQAFDRVAPIRFHRRLGDIKRFYRLVRPSGDSLLRSGGGPSERGA